MSYIITIYRASLFFYLFRIAPRSFRGNDAVDISRPMHVAVLLLQSDPGIRKKLKKKKKKYRAFSPTGKQDILAFKSCTVRAVDPSGTDTCAHRRRPVNPAFIEPYISRSPR